MYTQHWRLSGQPFENRFDSQFYYPAEHHQAALLKLHYTIENRRSAALVCGPTGIGKTLLVHELRRQLDTKFQPICHLVFPVMQESEWIEFMIESLERGASRNSTTNPSSSRTSQTLRRFEEFLKTNIEKDQHAVVIVDEAHLLEQQGLLEPLRLLLNVASEQASGEAAWTLVLIGQESTLAHVERYQALDERLAVKCMLSRFRPEETQGYVQHRLRAVGGDAMKIFSSDAMEAIEALSQGLPRRINRLCDLALMIGYAEEMKQITADVIDSVHNDLAPASL